MEDILQRIFAIFVTALVFFILPIYIAYEKVDDISYALALKITTSFVEDVTSKGYLSRNMYNDYVNKLSTTNNTYDIELEHVSKKYYPVFLVYTDDHKTAVKGTYDYMLYKDSYNDPNTNKMNFDGEDINKDLVTITYKVSEEKIFTSQIMDILDRKFDGSSATNTVYGNMDLSKYRGLTNIPAITTMYQLDNVNTSADKNIYTMNTGDEFNVIIKNKNTTIATVLFNTFTMGGSNDVNNTRVFVNYGGTIENMDYVNTVASTYSYTDYVGFENDTKFKVLLDGEYNKKDGHNSGLIMNLASENGKWTNLKNNSKYSISAETSYNGDPTTGVIAEPSWESNGLTFKRKSYLKIDNLDIDSMKSGYTMEIVLKYDNIEKDPSKTGSVRTITPIGNYNEGGMGIEYSTKFKKNYFTMGFDDGTGTNTYKMLQSSVDASANKIYSLSASYDGSKMVFYENGRKTTLDVNGLIPNIKTDYDMTIGLNPGLTNEFHFGGTIYSVRIYNRALTDSEILKNYEVDKSRFNIY